jgi:hypothetical protein
MKAFALFVVLLSPSLALAEVSDKMPSISAVLLQGSVVAALFFALSWFRWWLVVRGVLVSTFFTVGTIELWREVPIREALLNEQVSKYFVALATTDLLALAASILGAVFCWRKRHVAQPIIPPDAAR